MNERYYTQCSDYWTAESMKDLKKSIRTNDYKCRECKSNVEIFRGYHSLICKKGDLLHDSGYRIDTDFPNNDKQPKIVPKEEIDIKQYDIYLKNKDWIEEKSRLQSLENLIIQDYPLLQYYETYKLFKGKDSKEVFVKNVIIFISTLFPAYIGDLEKPDGTIWNGSRESFMCFAEYMKSFKKADRYFRSIDHVTAYS